MKKILTVCLGVFLLTACSEDKPGDVFLKYANKVQTGDYEGFSEGFCRDGRGLTNEEDSLNRLVMKAYCGYLEEKYGGLQKIEVVKDSLYEGNQRAQVRVRFQFANGGTEETEYEMNLVNGEWKIELEL